MTLQELVDQVINNTNRPDLGFTADGGDNQIPNAVYASTLLMHTLEYFWRDILSVDIVFDSPAYIQELDIPVLPRFRSIAYFRKWDPTFNSSQQNPTILPPLFNGISPINSMLALASLEIIDLGQGAIFDSYKTERQDVCYAAGSTLAIKSSTPLKQAKMGYYAFPLLDIANNGAKYSSWIAELYPWAIINHAIAAICANTGDLDRARELNRPANATRNDIGGLVAQSVFALRMGGIEAVGR